MTFQEYMRACQKSQRAYIAGEKRRMKKAARSWQCHETAMRALNLHPLNWREIVDRQRELDRMTTDVATQYGDNPGMRAAFEMRQ